MDGMMTGVPLGGKKQSKSDADDNKQPQQKDQKFNLDKGTDDKGKTKEKTSCC